MLGSGAISAPLRFALPHMPPIIIGKPNKPFMDCIAKVHKLDKSRTIMVGDRLDTDVSGCDRAACKLVLTGMRSALDFVWHKWRYIYPHGTDGRQQAPRVQRA